MKRGRLNRRTFLTLAGSAVASAAIPTRAQTKPPNIVLLLADDMGYRDLTCFGGVNPTPNLDALAEDGLRMTRFYAAAPVCTPTRASIMTGKYPLRFDIRQHYKDGPEFLPDDVATLPKLLKNAGYRTAHVGKWHLGGLHVDEDGHRVTATPGPREHGFDHYQCQIEQPPLRGIMNQERRLFREGGTVLMRDDVAINEDDSYFDKHFTDCNGDYAVEMIHRFADSGDPFFLNVWWLVPHKPYEPAPEPHWSDTAEDGITEDQHCFRSMVRHMDARIGDIVASLKDRGLLENTLIVFTSDNGGAFEANIGDLKGGKTDLHDGGLKVPFIAHWPAKIPAGISSDARASTIDFLATFCDAADASWPEDVDGTSLLDHWTDGAPLADRDLFFQIDLYRGLQRHYPKPKPYAKEVLMSGSWKLLTFDGEPVELFNIVDDPNERKNVLSDHPDLVARMAAKVKAWLAEPRRSWEDVLRESSSQS